MNLGELERQSLQPVKMTDRLGEHHVGIDLVIFGQLGTDQEDVAGGASVAAGSPWGTKKGVTFHWQLSQSFADI